VKTMFLSKLKIAATVLLLGSIFAIGTGEATRRVWAARSGPISQGPAETDSQARGTAHHEPGRGQAPGDTNALLKQALETAATITDPIARLRTLLGIASVQGKMGQRSEARKTRQDALQIAKELADGRSKVFSLVEVADAQAEGEGRSTALETLRQAEQAATAIPDANEQGNALSRVVMAHLGLEDYEGALRMAASMKDFQIYALVSIAQRIYMKRDSGPAGRQVLKQALEQAKSIGSVTDKDQQAFINIAAAYARVGDLNAALQIADTLGNSGKEEALEEIGIAQAGAGKIADALRTANDIEGYRKANVLQAVAAAQAKAGDRAAARATLQEMFPIADKLPDNLRPQGSHRYPGASSKALVRRAIVEAQVQLEDIEGALQTASAIDGEYAKAQALLEVGIAQLKAGKLADARKTLFRAAYAAEDSMRGISRGGRRGRSRPRVPILPVPLPILGQTLGSIAEEQAKAGDIKKALETVQSIADSPNARDFALVAIVQAQAQAGDVKGGLDTLERIQDENEEAFALQNLVQSLVRAGDEPGALALAARQTSPLLKAHALLAIASVKVQRKATKE
jgi:hypothetical protein